MAMICPAFPHSVRYSPYHAVTVVTDVPNGKETGTFLAMDLGGTNIRACSVELKGDGTFDMIQSKAIVPPSLQTAKTSTELFGYIADHLQNFLNKHHPEHCEGYSDEKAHYLRLGFTFSFPVIQTKINAGKLMRWTKGFSIEVRPLHLRVDLGNNRSGCY
jgi:hexokinase